MGERAGVNGVEIAYEVSGEGRRLVWCHGLASCRDGDRDVLDALVRHFTVLGFDARGHGESEPVREPERYSYPILTEDLIALLDHVGWDRAVLTGSSMGAASAARVAMAQPGRAEALVMIRPGSGGGPAPERLQMLFRLGAQAMMQGGLDAAVQFLHTIPEARAEIEKNPGRIDQLRVDWGRHDPASIAAALSAMPASAPLDDGVDPTAITAPVLVIPGNDPIHPTEAGIACAALVPHAVCDPPIPAAARADETERLVARIVEFAGA